MAGRLPQRPAGRARRPVGAYRRPVRQTGQALRFRPVDRLEGADLRQPRVDLVVGVDLVADPAAPAAGLGDQPEPGAVADDLRVGDDTVTDHDTVQRRGQNVTDQLGGVLYG